MSNIPFGDLIVLAAVAAFILLRYRSMLGEKSGRDASDATRKRIEEVERIIQLPQKTDGTAAKPAADIFADYEGSLRETLNGFRKLDPDFTAEDFLDGAKSAFEMLITAYRNGDLDTLKMLLSAPLYESFKKALEEEEKAGKKSHATVVAISKAEITGATLAGSQANVEVTFASDQIQLLRDKEGAILEGNASDEVEIDDRWKFNRDLKSTNPNWTIVET